MDIKQSLISMLAITLVSCATKNTYQALDVEQQLMNSALSAQDSLRTLAATQQSYAKNAINTDILVTPEGGMGGLATIDWSGPVEPLLEKICKMTNYRLKVLGPIPPIPVLVTIAGRERVIADILKDAGLQAGKKANVVVYPTSRIIELRYS